jgi:hypothetical protein
MTAFRTRNGKTQRYRGGRCVHCRRDRSESSRTFVFGGNWCCTDCAFHHGYGYPDPAENPFAEAQAVFVQTLFDRDAYSR